jgi:hypothetical protein
MALKDTLSVGSQEELQNTLHTLSKVRLHRYICLWWASERKLGKKPVTKQNQTKKTLEKSREQG